MIKYINEWQILTDSGFEDFDGVIKYDAKSVVKLLFDCGLELICTEDHKLFDKDLDVVKAIDSLNVEISQRGGKTRVIKLEHLEDTQEVYDILNAGENKRFYANDILVSNCVLLDEAAHIDENILSEFWSAVYPVISSSKTARIIVTSTPNGEGNLFHRLFTEAVDGINGWGHLTVYWHEVPGRDEKWYKDQIKTLGEDLFEQEFNCKFLTGSTAFLPEDLAKELQSNCGDPMFTFDDDHYKVWESPNLNERCYCAGVDVGEGLGGGACASTISILDITELHNIREVATYHNNAIHPNLFARKVNDIMIAWGKPPLVVERNNTGGGIVLEALSSTFNYPHIVSFAMKQGNYEYGHLTGATSSTNSKHHAVSNFWFWLKDKRAVQLRDKFTLTEIRTFVRHKNSRWGKKSNAYFDDRVDALMWALICLHKDIIVQYFNIEVKDPNEIPLVLSPAYAIYKGKNDSIYDFVFGDDRTGDEFVGIFGGGTTGVSDIDDLLMNGWEMVGGTPDDYDTGDYWQ